MGTLTVDGAAYDVLSNTQVNQSDINGQSSTFVQYFSLRQTARQCGHITLTDHFKAWAGLGLEMSGKMEEAGILVEAMNNSGTVDFTSASVAVTK